MSLGAPPEPGNSRQFQHAWDCSPLRRAGAVSHGLGAIINLWAEEPRWELEVVRGVRRAVPPQGHFSPSSTTSPQIHGPQEVTGNLIGFKTATCPESARCLSRRGRESKMFTASGDAATAEQGRQAGLPGVSQPRQGETVGISDVLCWKSLPWRGHLPSSSAGPARGIQGSPVPPCRTCSCSKALVWGAPLGCRGLSQ